MCNAAMILSVLKHKPKTALNYNVTYSVICCNCSVTHECAMVLVNLFAVKVVENKHAYFAERLYHSMKVSVVLIR